MVDAFQGQLLITFPPAITAKVHELAKSCGIVAAGGSVSLTGVAILLSEAQVRV